MIELLVVVSIISLLVAVLLPSLSSARNAAKATACLSNQRQIGVSFYAYATDQDGFIHAFGRWLDPGNNFLYWGEPLLDDDYHQDGDAMICPSWPPAAFTGNFKQTYGINYDTWQTHNPGGIAGRVDGFVRVTRHPDDGSTSGFGTTFGLFAYRFFDPVPLKLAPQNRGDGSGLPILLADTLDAPASVPAGGNQDSRFNASHPDPLNANNGQIHARHSSAAATLEFDGSASLSSAARLRDRGIADIFLGAPAMLAP